MTKRGAVQSYEGHVNSHTRLQLGVISIHASTFKSHFTLIKASEIILCLPLIYSSQEERIAVCDFGASSPASCFSRKKFLIQFSQLCVGRDLKVSHLPCIVMSLWFFICSFISGWITFRCYFTCLIFYHLQI
jgi:hypothetical protein